MVTDMMESNRNFAHIRLSGPSDRVICCFCAEGVVAVVTGDGIVCKYGVDMGVGGECKLLSENRLIGARAAESTAAFV